MPRSDSDGQSLRNRALPANLTLRGPHPYTGRVIISQAPGLGFSVTDIEHAVQDPRFQRVAATAIQNYAPGLVPPPPMPYPMPPPDADAHVPDPDGAPIERKVGVQKNNFMPFVIGGGILLLTVMILRR